MEAAGSAYPAVLTFDAPLQMPRWRALFSIIAVIPHLVVNYALNIVAEVLTVVAWFAIMFTGKLPEGIAGVQCMCIRYSLRAATYAGALVQPYPPFTFATTPADPGDYAGMRLDYRPQYEDRNRLTVFFRILLVIPHAIVLGVLGIGAVVCFLIGLIAVLITGSWPEGLRGFILKVMGWSVRFQAYCYLLTDEYPPFELG